MSRRRQRRRPRRAPARTTAPTTTATTFWGQEQTARTPARVEPIRPTPDPAAVLRSLGNPPLTPAAAEQLAVVYQEAVRAATALAAANDLLASDPSAGDSEP